MFTDSSSHAACLQIIQSFLKAQGILKCDPEGSSQPNAILCANKAELHHFWASASLGGFAMMLLRCMSGK